MHFVTFNMITKLHHQDSVYSGIHVNIATNYSAIFLSSFTLLETYNKYARHDIYIYLDLFQGH